MTPLFEKCLMIILTSLVFLVLMKETSGTEGTEDSGGMTGSGK